MTGLKITHQRSGRAWVMTLVGRVDNASAGEVQSELKALIDTGEKTILLDLTGVTYLTSAAFRVLLVAARDSERAVARFALCGVTGHVRDLFELGGLAGSFTILGPRDEALASLA